MTSLDFVNDYIQATNAKWVRDGVVHDVVVRDQEYLQWCKGLEAGSPVPSSWTFFWEHVDMDKMGAPTLPMLEFLLDVKRHAWALPLLNSYTKKSPNRTHVIHLLNAMEVSHLLSASILLEALGRDTLLPAIYLFKKKNTNIHDMIKYVPVDAPCWHYEPIVMEFFHLLASQNVDVQTKEYAHKVLQQTSSVLQSLMREKIAALEIKTFYQRNDNFPAILLSAFYQYYWNDFVRETVRLEVEELHENNHLRAAFMYAFLERYTSGDQIPTDYEMHYAFLFTGWFFSQKDSRETYQSLLTSMQERLTGYGVDCAGLIDNLWALTDGAVDVAMFVDAAMKTFRQSQNPIEEVPLLD